MDRRFFLKQSGIGLASFGFMAAAPEFLKLERRDDLTWIGALEGPVSQLIEWLAGRPIADLTIGRPDLESLFRRYYKE